MIRSLVLLLVFLATSASAGALVVDPPPDTVGLFFDQYADGGDVYVPDPPRPVTLYYILTNPTMAGVDAYEFTLRLEMPPGEETNFFILDSSIADGQALGVDTGDKDAALEPEYIVGLATPVPCGLATILHTWQLLVQGDFVIELFLGPADPPSLPGGLPVIQAAGVGLMTVGTRVPDLDSPQAYINMNEPLAVESSSFGSVKALYR